MKKFIALMGLLLISQLGSAMSIFDAGKVYTFSEVNLKLTKDGEPIPNAKVSRKVEWKKEKIEEAVTNGDGEVHFPAVFERSAAKFLPMEIVIAQVITVEVDGEVVKIWGNTKRDELENSELGGRSLNLTCEITDKKQLYRDFGSMLGTICKWD